MTELPFKVEAWKNGKVHRLLATVLNTSK